MAHPSAIKLTEQDYRRLRELLPATGRDIPPALEVLEDLLDSAEVIEPERVPRDVATMNSTVRYRDVRTGEEGEFTIVYPEDADPARGRISVLSPVGAALIGHAEGDEAELPLPHGRTRGIRILQILFQPEAAGHFHL